MGVSERERECHERVCHEYHILRPPTFQSSNTNRQRRSNQSINHHGYIMSNEVATSEIVNDQIMSPGVDKQNENTDDENRSVGEET